ncbi:tetratricopeptide repeat protein [Pedobacter sp. SAFR-022]|uniref:tetratricopeptide repeat protein n=1 Tax=Pedobacter sp. SAFR-022 TaxID=3436861 RepID=UPI003F7D681A
MKKGLLFTLATLFCCQALTYAQDTTDQSIRKLLDMERQAWTMRDSTAFFALLNESPSFTFTNTGSGYSNHLNVNTFHDALTTAWKQPPTGKPNTYENSDIKSQVVGNRAFTEFTRTTIDSNNKRVRQTLETWTLSNKNGSWKIDRILSVDTSSFNPSKVLSDTEIEDEINMVGYRLLAAKKNEQAIRIFKMNTEFFPKAWNTYDSLGEAYMINGNKKEAIANYEQSMKLNPKNTNGKEFLEKLRKGK